MTGWVMAEAGGRLVMMRDDDGRLQACRTVTAGLWHRPTRTFLGDNGVRYTVFMDRTAKEAL